MNSLLEYLLLHHFGYIFLGLCLLIASFILKNKLSQLISLLLKTQRLQPGNPHPTPIKTSDDLPPLPLLPPSKPVNTELSDEEFQETFGMPCPKETEETTESAPSTKTDEDESIASVLMKAARGERK